MHPPSLRKVVNHNSSPWFESIRDELYKAKRERHKAKRERHKAKRERHKADRKLKNTKLTISKNLY